MWFLCDALKVPIVLPDVIFLTGPWILFNYYGSQEIFPMWTHERGYLGNSLFVDSCKW